MHTYHITYYYLATGMEGRADTADYGTIEAWSADEAIAKMGLILNPKTTNKSHREWGLSATLVRRDTSKITDI